jgi:molybdopterin converting factor small subunit
MPVEVRVTANLFLGKLDTPLKEGDTLAILSALAGGER